MIAADEVAAIFREESGRAIAALVSQFRSIDLAEESVQDAFMIALQHWPDDGRPANPGAWITVTARNRAIDVIRRESSRDARQIEATSMYRDEPDPGPMGDDRLRLIFTCCHPALAPAARIALTLRLLGGLQTPEIARAFLAGEATMAQRLVRAKRKPEALGLLALLLLIDGRRPARTAPDGSLVRLEDQDRARWDRPRIQAGQAIVRRLLARNQPGPFQIQAAINAVHSDAATAALTDWGQILALYDQLLAFMPTPVVALNRAIAAGEVHGGAGRPGRDRGARSRRLRAYHAARAELLRRLGRDADAARAYDVALGLTANLQEQRFLAARRAQVSGAGPRSTRGSASGSSRSGGAH